MAIKIKVTHALNFSEADKVVFKAILEKSQAVDTWSSASQYVMAVAILQAFEAVQDNLNKAGVDIAQGQLDAKTKAGKPVKITAKKRAHLESLIKAKGVGASAAGFDEKNVEDAMYKAVDWPANVAKTADGKFNQLVRRAARTALVIWENPKEYAMQSTPVLDKDGKNVMDESGQPREALQPIEAAYLAFDKIKKNPGMQMVDGSLMAAKDNPEMYEPDGAPKMLDSGWRSIESAYKKMHPGKTGGGNGQQDLTDAEAFQALASGSAVPDTTKIAAITTLVLRLTEKPELALKTEGAKAIIALKTLAPKIAALLTKVDNLANEAKAKADADVNDEARARAAMSNAK